MMFWDVKGIKKHDFGLNQAARNLKNIEKMIKLKINQEIDQIWG